MNGVLIAIEGLDGAGKATQTKLLAERLNAQFSQPTKVYSFPRYETSTGVEVARYLRGEIGELNPLQKAKLYADDRLAAREEILDDVYRGCNIVCDRYYLSNLYFVAQASLLVKEGKAISSYPDSVWYHIAEEELVRNDIAVPDMTILLDLPLEVTKENVLKKEQRRYTDSKQDIHERDFSLLAEVHKQYHHYLNLEHPNIGGINPFGLVEIIDCFDYKTNTIKSVQEIHELVYKAVMHLR